MAHLFSEQEKTPSCRPKGLSFAMLNFCKSKITLPYNFCEGLHVSQQPYEVQQRQSLMLTLSSLEGCGRKWEPDQRANQNQTQRSLGFIGLSFKWETPGGERILVQFSGVSQEEIKPHN